MKKCIYILLLLLYSASNNSSFAQFNFKKVKFTEIENEQDLTSLIKKIKNQNKYLLVVFASKNYINYDDGFKGFIKELKNGFNVDSIANFTNNNFECAFIKYTFNTKYEIETNLFKESLKQSCKIGRIVMYYVYFDNTGKVIHKNSLSSNYKPNNTSNFFSSLNAVLDTNKQCYTQLYKFRKGEKDTSFIKKMFKTFIFSNDDSTDEFVYDFINTQQNIYTTINADVLMSSFSHYAAFEHLYKNHDEWVKIIDEKTLDSFYRRSIYKITQEAYYWVFNFKIPNNSLINTIATQYPKYGRLQSTLFLLHQLGELNNTNTNSFDNIVQQHFDDTLMQSINANDMNSLAWTVFTNSSNKKSLSIALNFSKQSLVSNENNHHFLDTYANLLYKLGRKDEAIDAEKKALKNADEKSKLLYERTLNWIETNQKTW